MQKLPEPRGKHRQRGSFQPGLHPCVELALPRPKFALPNELHPSLHEVVNAGFFTLGEGEVAKHVFAVG